MSTVNIDFPFHVDQDGRTAVTDHDDHIRDMIEQVLFTGPGERVNRPEFGTSLLQLIFAPNSAELATALQATVRASLQRWLGDVIELHAVDVTSTDAVVNVVVRFAVRRTGEGRTVRLERAV